MINVSKQYWLLVLADYCSKSWGGKGSEEGREGGREGERNDKEEERGIVYCIIFIPSLSPYFSPGNAVSAGTSRSIHGHTRKSTAERSPNRYCPPLLVILSSIHLMSLTNSALLSSVAAPR